MPSPSRRVTLPFVVAWAIFATYVVAARGVRNFFPISVFDMYQRRAPAAVSRVIVIDADGAEHRLEHFTAFHCEPAPPALGDVRRYCGEDHEPLDYVMRDQQRELDAHLSGVAGPLSIGIVSRSTRIPTDGSDTTTDDCVLARCTARLREAP